MNRSKFYFLFSIFAAVLIGGVLITSIALFVPEKVNACHIPLSSPYFTSAAITNTCPPTISWTVINPNPGPLSNCSVGAQRAPLTSLNQCDDDDYVSINPLNGVNISFATLVAGASISGSVQDNFSSSGSYAYMVNLYCGGTRIGFRATNPRSVTCGGGQNPPTVSCSPKNSSLNVGDVRTFTGSPSGGTGSYIYHWRSNVTCGEEWTCSSNGQISSSENQCKVERGCPGTCSHTSGQDIQNCKLFFGASGTYTPTIDVASGAQTATDSCSVNVSAQAKYRCSGSSCIRDDANGTFTDPSCNNQCVAQTGNLFTAVRLGSELHSTDNCAVPVSGSYSGAANESFACAPRFFSSKPVGTYNFSYSGPSQITFNSTNYTFNNITYATGNTLIAGGNVTAYYNFRTSAPPPTCTINGQTNGSTSVRVGDHFVIPWSNSPNLQTLMSSGWSGPITCVGDESVCKAMHSMTGLPACPPESGTCSWGGHNGSYLLFQEPGTSNVTITATNAAGQQGTCSHSVTATAVTACTLVISPPSGSVLKGSTFQFNALYDPDGPGGPQGEQNVSSSANWRSDNTAIATSQGSGRFLGVNASPPPAGIHATYSGCAGRQADASLNVTSAPNNPPIINSCDINPKSGNAPLNTNYTSSVSDPDGDAISIYRWNFGLGNTDRGPSGTFTYASQGTFSVTLQAQDARGAWSSQRTCGTVTIGSGNQLPTGAHDTNDNPSCTALGWTADPDDRNRDLTVKIYSDGALIKTDTADRFRPDLQSAGVCPGGTCAFVTSIAGLVSTGVSHSIAVRALDAQTGQEQPLGGSPKNISCAVSLQNCDTSYPNDTFHACYFDGVNPPSGANPVLAQNNESTIDHDWGGGQVNATGKNDQVSGIWRGRINFPAGNYVFHTLSDDGVALNLEGFGDIISNWTDHAPTQNNSSSITLPAGQRNVTLKWYENGGGAAIKLWWDSAVLASNNASCLGITAPNTVTAGQSFGANVVMRNTGTKTWTTDVASHRLGSQNPQDNTRWRDGRVALPSDVAPNTNVTFNFNNTAPSTPGTYPFDWKMVEDGVEWFGQTCAKTITVNPVTSDITVSGRVFNETTGTGFASATISTCRSSPATVSTDSNGNFSFSVPRQSGFCARVSPETRAGFAGPSLNNNSGLEWAKTYEWQVAGWNCATQGGCNSDQNTWDRASDNGYDFRYTPSGGGNPQCSDGTDNDGDGKIDFPADPGCSNAGDNNETDFCSDECSSGASRCTDTTHIQTCGNFDADSCLEWGPTPPNSCPAGQQCISGSCAALPPNPPTGFTASAGPACNIVNFFWTDTNSPPADSFTISCNSGAITISGITGNSYPFTGAEGNTTYNCAIAAVRSGLSSSARPMDTGPITTSKCPDFGLNRFGELAVILSTAGTPKNTNTVTIEVTNAGTSFTGNVNLSFVSVSGGTSAFTAVSHFGSTTLAPGQTTTLYVTVSGAQPIGTYNGFVNIRGYAPSLDTSHTIAVPLKVEVKSPGFREI